MTEPIPALNPHERKRVGVLDVEVAYMDTGEGFAKIILPSAVLGEFTEEGTVRGPTLYRSTPRTRSGRQLPLSSPEQGGNTLFRTMR